MSKTDPLTRVGPSIEAPSCLEILLEHMHELFNTGSPLVVGILLCLLELDQNNGIEKDPQSLLAIILSLLMDRSHLARVCRDWSKLLSDIQSLSLTSIHLNAFGCRGNAKKLFARCTILKNFHSAARSLEDPLCKHTIAKFLTLPWHLRVARLKTFFHRSDTFNREIFGEELIRVQSFFSPQTVALMECAIAEYSPDNSIPTRWSSASHQRSQAVYMQYELLNFRWGHQRTVAADEFVARFKDVKVRPWRNSHPMHGSCWVAQAVVQLSSVLCLPPQINHEVNCNCIFNFRNQFFGAVMRVILDRLSLTFDFVHIPSSSLDV